MAKRITTVCGDIAPEQLGFTSMHDHTFVDLSLAGAFMEAMFAGMPSRMLAFTPENYAFLKNGSYLANKELQAVDDLELLVKEYGFFKAAGGQSVCDPGPIGLRGDVGKRPELSRRTGLNIICIDLGFGDQITLGNDFSSKLAARTYGGYGCTRFIDFGMALMKQLGREAQARKLVCENPARILAY